MVCDSTRGVDTTDPRTGISTLVIDTGLVIGTLGVGDTLWLALNIRIAIIERWTFADALCIGLYPNLAGG